MRTGPMPHSSLIFIQTIYLDRINKRIIYEKMDEQKVEVFPQDDEIRENKQSN
jgi:hypothetical protein